MMDEPRIRAGTAADVPAIADIVDQAYQHYIARIGKPPGPMLDDYTRRCTNAPRCSPIARAGARVAGHDRCAGTGQLFPHA
jgi:hypothetical protein